MSKLTVTVMVLMCCLKGWVGYIVSFINKNAVLLQGKLRDAGATFGSRVCSVCYHRLACFDHKDKVRFDVRTTCSPRSQSLSS